MRELREAEAVSAALDDAVERWPRAQDAWEAASWAIARDPLIGRPMTEGATLRVAVWVGARSLGMPTITLTCREDGEAILIVDAIFEDSEYGDAGHA